MDSPVAVGRQFGDDRLDLGHELVVWQRWPTDPRLWSFLQPLIRLERDTPITSATAFIGKRPSAATAAAQLFLSLYCAHHRRPDDRH